MYFVNGSIFLKKNRQFIIHERFNILIYDHKMWHLTPDHKMWHLTPCKIPVCLSFLKWIKNETIFYSISESMLATLIQRYDKKCKNISVLIRFKNERLTETLQTVTCHILWSYLCHITINETFLLLRSMGPLSLHGGTCTHVQNLNSQRIWVFLFKQKRRQIFNLSIAYND